MGKQSKAQRQTVALPPSRIRRDPPAPPAQLKALKPYAEEREAWTVAVGVVAFALAIMIIILAASDYTSG